MNTRQNGGFTLIELVVVIALLGILAAFAIPRFASLEREARIATVQGLSGSVRSASTMAHALFIATGATPVTMEGASINITNGYPDANDIANTLADTSGFAVSVNGGGDVATGCFSFGIEPRRDIRRASGQAFKGVTERSIVHRTLK